MASLDGLPVRLQERLSRLLEAATLDHTHTTHQHKTGHHEVRTHEDTKKSAYAAQRSGKPVDGVNDHSLFHLVPTFNIIENVAIDYMHGLVLGVVKMLVSLCFVSSHHKEAFNI